MKIYEKYVGLFKTDEQLKQEGLRPQASREMVAGMVAGIALLGAVGSGVAIYNEIKENQHCETILNDPNAPMDEITDCY